MKEIIIKEKIAVGGMATVYLGEWGGKRVVIKKLHPHLAGDADFLIRFEREAEILKTLNHPNIIKFLHYERKGEEAFIVLEYIEGKTLREIIKERERIPVPAALYIMKEILSGIKYAHAKGIIHRDVKPENIMISEKGEIKIADFGLAFGEAYPRVTEPGMYVGTPEYIAPEVLSGKKYSEKSDYFALGIMLYEMVTGEVPTRGRTPYETINKILYGKIPPPSQLVKIPEGIERIIMKLIAKNPKDRYQSCEEIDEDIKRYLSIGKREFIHWLKDPTLPLPEVPAERKKEIRTLVLLTLLLLSVILWEWKGKEIEIPEAKPPPPPRIERKIEKPSKPVQPPPPPEEEKKPQPTPPGYGWLKITSTPWAYVFIDGKKAGETPFGEPFKLKEGKHIIRFENPSREAVTETVEIKKNDTLLLSVDLPEKYGYLIVKVKPWAEVYIDGEKIGVTPMGKIPLEPGKHTLELRHPKYGTYKEEIEIERGRRLEKHHSFY